MQQYDVVIVGAGVSGLFAAMQLAKQATKTVLVIDSGKSLPERLTALGADIASHQSSDRYYGFGGLGLSEGKYNYTNDFGGQLAEKIGTENSLLYQHKVDELLCYYGAAIKPLYGTFAADLMAKATLTGFKILSTQTRHLGTSLSTHIFKRFYDFLSSRIEFCFNTDIINIESITADFIVTLANQTTVTAKSLIIAVGRHGLSWFEPIANRLQLPYEKTRLDLGFRIEMYGKQLESLLKNTFETKLYHQSEHYNATTYCMNPNGRVIPKYQDGLVMPDGQNSNEVGQSNNLNFSLFIPTWFNSRMAADNYLQSTITTINQHKGIIAAQRLGEIDKRFNDKTHIIEPTLSTFEFTHLQTITPTNYLTYTCDFLFALQKLLEKPISGNTILYAMDSKSYAATITTDHQFATYIPNLYIIGDCSGVTSSLAQAAASGLFVAEQLV